MILLGSCALSKVAPHLLDRAPSDVDILCTEEELQNWTKGLSVKAVPSENGGYITKVGDVIFEFEIIKDSHSSSLLRGIVESDPESKEDKLGLIPSLDVLFALKTSHRFRKNSPNFWKTLSDWHNMKRAGAKVRESHKEFVKLREKEVSFSTPKLNVKKADFFDNDSVEYTWDHDSIHVSVAKDQAPAYLHYLIPGEEVMCSKGQFDSLPQEIKIAGVTEESAVLAIERSLWPHRSALTESQAWNIAFSKVCTSITSGWFREFAYENAPEILQNRPVGFWDRFLDDVSKNKIKPFRR